jgi:thiol-disulfide isomerase/thioredoxin
MYELEKLVENSEDVKYYIDSSKEKTSRFIEQYNSYILDSEAVTKIRCHSDKYMIITFSAEWCPDCYYNIPILAQLQEQTRLQTRVFGHLKRDAKNSAKLWRIPPSPEEVEDFNVVKIPSIFILDKGGNKVGQIIENSPKGKSLETAILDILES